MANLENMGDGLTKDELNAHLEKYLKNIQEDPWFKTPDGKKYVELAKTTTEEIAKEPWKPSGLLLLVQPLFGGAIALLVLALLLKLSA
ncbi:unnamed protein product [Peronospora farinosa]|uniref:Uncharacterized protein n=1 Tax=Peronospora farinosa TaxID=134698 RepID=A0AAV0SU38_9STRA|nr:unnamed protein product [Peronospora farinosa]CAI5708273.1 unnamed protein product [Peronospora farinosa]